MKKKTKQIIPDKNILFLLEHDKLVSNLNNLKRTKISTILFYVMLFKSSDIDMFIQFLTKTDPKILKNEFFQNNDYLKFRVLFDKSANIENKAKYFFTDFCGLKNSDLLNAFLNDLNDLIKAENYEIFDISQNEKEKQKAFLKNQTIINEIKKLEEKHFLFNVLMFQSFL